MFLDHHGKDVGHNPALLHHDSLHDNFSSTHAVVIDEHSFFIPGMTKIRAMRDASRAVNTTIAFFDTFLRVPWIGRHEYREQVAESTPPVSSDNVFSSRKKSIESRSGLTNEV